MLVRKLKRRTSLEEQDAEEVLKAEFSHKNDSPDLELSTYAIELERLVQHRSEHCAGSGLDKPSSAQYVDVRGLHDRYRATDDNRWFRYTNAAHRELLFTDRLELLAFVQGLIARRPTVFDVSRPDCKAYVRRALDLADAEWLGFVDEHANGQSWKHFVGGT